ncbi:MAG: hypothetical protein IKA22_02400, partial [Lentisphaeria bacterium]|nr:hypothetical protein [Lentisphaeria bacterium]
MADELEKIEISNGEISSGEIYGYGDNITVKSGGTLDDAYIPSSAGSLTLEAGAILTDNITIGVNTTVQGVVNAGKANLNLDISDRKEESGVLLSELSYVASKSLTVTVDNNQDKGIYILAGNAADYYSAITITDDLGTVLGAISHAQPQFDYGMTRYNLAVNSANQLTLTVSSNISDSSDNVFLYKNGILISSHNSIVDGKNVATQDDIDKIYVSTAGQLTNVTISEGGNLILASGGNVIGLTLKDNRSVSGNIVFDASFKKDDGTILSGSYEYEEYDSESRKYIVKNDYFDFSNNVLNDIVVTSGSQISAFDGITVDGAVMRGGQLNLEAGSILTGTVSGNSGTIYL